MANFSIDNQKNINKMETNHIANLAKYELPELQRKGFFRRWHYMPTQKPVSRKEYYFIAYDYND